MNSSTFIARIAASTGADCAAALSAAVGALSGPLHGGAPTRVLKMLDDVEAGGDPTRMSAPSSTAASGSWASAIASTAPRIPGRASCAARRASSARRGSRSPRRLEQAALAALRERSPDRVLETNVEFWAAVVLESRAMPPPMYPAMFGCAPDRQAGRPTSSSRSRHRAADPAVRALRRRAGALAVTLAEAAVEANALAEAGSERELAELRAKWDEEVEHAARSQDFRERAVAYRAIGQFRFRQKTELLRRGLEDVSPACRGSALLSLELLSRDHPGVVNGVRPLLHEMVSRDDNDAVRRLAVMSLRNGSAQRDTIGILAALADDDEAGRELREAAGKVAQVLRRKAGPAR